MTGKKDEIFNGLVINPWKGKLKGEVLKSLKKISFLGDVNPENGVIVAPDSDIKGFQISERILVFPSGRGSTVGAGVLYGLAKKGLAPKMLITLEPEQVVISGAIFGDIPMISNVSIKFFEIVESGQFIETWIEDDKKAVIRIL
jgi:hypothetical protein